MGENQTKYCIKVYGIQQRKKNCTNFCKIFKIWLVANNMAERTNWQIFEYLFIFFVFFLKNNSTNYTFKHTYNSRISGTAQKHKKIFYVNLFNRLSNFSFNTLKFATFIDSSCIILNFFWEFWINCLT